MAWHARRPARAIFWVFVALVASAAIFQLPARAAEMAPIEVMVLGTFHMDNPGRDVVNAKVDPVTGPVKQAQIAAAVEKLAAFRPTAIALERVASDQTSLVDQRYGAFALADLTTKPDERVQIGYRLAHRLGLGRVYAIDEQNVADEPDYFPYEAVEAWAKAHGQQADLAALNQPVRDWAAKFEAAQKTRSVGDLLYEINTPGTELYISDMGPFYYRLLRFGAGRDLPGAELNGRWYTRNAKIFAKLMQVARPGDRIVVLFGSGHGYWLRHFVRETPGFRLVEPAAYLRARDG